VVTRVAFRPLAVELGAPAHGVYGVYDLYMDKRRSTNVHFVLDFGLIRETCKCK
jgi:hypothetical protein